VFHPATQALNRSIALLREVGMPQAQAYLARVFNTFGQVLQHQGLLSDARAVCGTLRRSGR
jgi:hypothetical protein